MTTSNTTRQQSARRRRLTAVLLSLAALLLLSLPIAAEFTQEFPVSECGWSNRGGNRYMSLEPGTYNDLEGMEDGAVIRQLITILPWTRALFFKDQNDRLIFVRTRVLEEREWEEGELAEVSRNFVARCIETGDIYYFGEEVDDYEDGEIVSHEGAWRVGRNGALPGILMPGSILQGAKYYQENALADEAVDRVENAEMGLDVDTPAGSFSDCFTTVETTELEPGDESEKQFCPGIGVVVDEDLVLVDYGVIAP